MTRQQRDLRESQIALSSQRRQSAQLEKGWARKFKDSVGMGEKKRSVQFEPTPRDQHDQLRSNSMHGGDYDDPYGQGSMPPPPPLSKSGSSAGSPYTGATCEQSYSCGQDRQPSFSDMPPAPPPPYAAGQAAAPPELPSFEGVDYYSGRQSCSDGGVAM